MVSFRKALADSHVASVAIAVFLLWSLGSLFNAAAIPLAALGKFLVTAVAILDIPYFSWPSYGVTRFNAILVLLYLWSSALNLASAWLVSSWVFDLGPVRVLSSYRNRLARRK